MADLQTIEFIDNPALAGREHNYVTMTVKTQDVLKSWQLSLFSFEWLNKDGSIKKFGELPEKEQPKRQEVEDKLFNAEPLVKPVLGIGIQDNVEIGIGRAVFLTLAAQGLASIPVHIPKSNESDFKAFLAEIN